MDWTSAEFISSKADDTSSSMVYRRTYSTTYLDYVEETEWPVQPNRAERRKQQRADRKRQRQARKKGRQ